MSRSVAVCLIFLVLIFHVGHLLAQQTDTIANLPEVTIQSYFTDQPLLNSPSSGAVTGSKRAEKMQSISALQLVNEIPGVRMEKRSPGSYRFSIRGSLLRSPFGIRNIKMYIDEMPFTDAGGNTYFNLIDPYLLERIEILKGPDASLFGANSGGVVRLNFSDDAIHTDTVQAKIQTGSFGLFHEGIKAHLNAKKHSLFIGESFLRSDGYRDNSALERINLFVHDNWNYAHNASLKIFVLAAQVDYETPGGLTLEQWEADDQQARPPTATLPGASEQNAGIINKSVLGGIINSWDINESFRHVISVNGIYTDFENPFITNFETRLERSGSTRSWLQYKNNNASNFKYSVTVGGEVQMSKSHIKNYENESGSRGKLQDDNNLDAFQYFAFLKTSFTIYERWIAEISSGINFNTYKYRNNSIEALPESERSFEPQFMPRFAVSYRIVGELYLRAIVSKGYSVPTFAEVLPSGNVPNLEIEPEKGYNYEAGLRFFNFNSKMRIDAAIFRYKLTDAIIRRPLPNDEEVFVNAGSVLNMGVETQLSIGFFAVHEIERAHRLSLSVGYTYNDFIYDEYMLNDIDFHGNEVAGVPSHVIVSSVDVVVKKIIRLNVSHNYTSKIPLNDANSVYSKSYNLLQAKIQIQILSLKKLNMEIEFSADNILDEKYSLGHDLNAVGGRYYNAAAERNYGVGVNLNL